jgi:hypothetical protein
MSFGPGLRIDRLSIRVPGLEPELARRLGQLVAERLATPLALAGGDAALSQLDVRVTAVPGESHESLAGRIAAQVSHAIAARALEAGR